MNALKRNWQLELLRTHGLRPRKSLSQNFLLDESYLARIADSAELHPSDTVLEIGPGLGGLTWHLARRVRSLVAVEIDERLAAVLRAEFSREARVRIVHQDILASCIPDLLWGRHAPPAPNGYRVVANLPYHAANRILMHLYEHTCPRPVRTTILVQEDVAERICARPGAMSLLAVGAQYHASCHLRVRIPPGAFYPVPKVRSALVDLQTRPMPRCSNREAGLLFSLARAGFSQKRKQLANPLSQALALPRIRVQDLLRAAGVDPQRRAETLSVEEWVAVARQFVGAGITAGT